MLKTVLSLILLAAIGFAGCATASAKDQVSHGKGLIEPEFERAPFELKMPKLLGPLPSRFDWREQGKVTPVKDQGSCGDCYAFASIANFESKVLVDSSQSFDLSENNVKECNFCISYFRYWCYGGTYWWVVNGLSTAGAVLEECDRYQPYYTGCKSDCRPVKTLLDWRAISENWQAPTEVLKQCVLTYGPVFVGLYAGNHDAWEYEFAHYDGSYVLNYTGGANAANHAGLIVGWDDSLSYPGGQGAWIVKNSWGTNWGGPCGYGDENGYYKLAYGSALIGKASSFIYEWEDYDPKERLFYYDEGGFNPPGFGYGSSTMAWGLCRFVPDKSVRLERVEFWSFDPILNADVYIYSHFDGNNLSGLLTSQPGYYVDFMGYHSIKLASQPIVNAGDTVYVVMKITDESDTTPIPVDRLGPKTPGVCFTSPDGVNWTELTTSDIGIRLRASEHVDIIPPKLSIKVEHGASLPGEIDVLVTASEELDPASLVVKAADESLTMEADPSAEFSYKGHYTLAASGLITISAEANDLAGNPGSATATLAASEITATEGGTASSEDTLLEVAVGKHVVSDDAYLLVSPVETTIPGVVDAYEVTPSALELADFVEVSISYAAGFTEPEHICIARLEDSGAIPLKSFIDTSRHRIVAYVDSLGSLGLYQADDVSSSPIGVGNLKLSQNYPNPFEGRTSIVYELPRSGHVTLGVFNVEGRLVRQLLDDEVTRGLHRTEWDGTDSRGKAVASGVYYLRADTGSGSANRKMLIVN